MPWVKRIKIGPVKHFYSFINNAFQLICTLSTQCVGAVAVPDFLIYAEYFIRKDFGDKWYENPNLSYEEYKYPTTLEYDSDEYFLQKDRGRDIYGLDSDYLAP